MILTKDHLDRLMSTDKQAVEISRILNAFPGEVLFTVPFLSENDDVIETLFNKCGVHYEKRKTGDAIEYIKLR